MDFGSVSDWIGQGFALIGIAIAIGSQVRVRRLERRLEPHLVECDVSGSILKLENNSPHPITDIQIIGRRESADPKLRLPQLSAGDVHPFDITELRGASDLVEIDPLTSGLSNEPAYRVLFSDFRDRSWEISPGGKATLSTPRLFKHRERVARYGHLLPTGLHARLRRKYGMGEIPA